MNYQLIVKQHRHHKRHHFRRRWVSGEHYGVRSIEQLHSYGVRRDGVDAGLEGRRFQTDAEIVGALCVRYEHLIFAGQSKIHVTRRNVDENAVLLYLYKIACAT